MGRVKNPQPLEIFLPALLRKENPVKINLLGSQTQEKILRIIGNLRKEIEEGDKKKHKIEKEKRKKF